MKFSVTIMWHVMVASFVLVGMLTCLDASVQSTFIRHQRSNSASFVSESFDVTMLADADWKQLSDVDLFMDLNPSYVEGFSVSSLSEGQGSIIVGPMCDDENGLIRLSAFDLGESMVTSPLALLDIHFLTLASMSLTTKYHTQRVSPKSILAHDSVNTLSFVETFDLSI